MANDQGPELLADQPTASLSAAREALRMPIPSDPGFLTALAGVVAALVDRELRHSGRKGRDEAEAKQREKDIADRAKQDEKARADTETAAHAAEKKGSTSQRATA